MLTKMPPNARTLVASELSMLSKGLPPPLPTLPDLCDSSAAVLSDGGVTFNEVDVEVDVIDGDGDGAIGVFPIMPFEAEG
jgi:hypothetical protein